MATAVITPSAEPLAPTPLAAKLLDMLASPSDVFEEVIGAPPRVVNWLVPTLFASFAGLVLLAATSNKEHTAAVIAGMVEAGKLSATQAQSASGNWQGVASLVTCLGAFIGNLWSAFLLWFIGLALLKTRFSYLKAVEVVALTSVITALGAVVTALLVAASGDVAARPALSLFVRHLAPGTRVFLMLDTLNLFHLWATTVLALGLARLSGVSFKEAAFWVFGYWVVTRIVVLTLA